MQVLFDVPRKVKTGYLHKTPEWKKASLTIARERLKKRTLKCYRVVPQAVNRYSSMSSRGHDEWNTAQMYD